MLPGGRMPRRDAPAGFETQKSDDSAGRIDDPAGYDAGYSNMLTLVAGHTFPHHETGFHLLTCLLAETLARKNSHEIGRAHV